MALLLLAPAVSHAADVVLGAIYPTTPAGADARHAVETALAIVNDTHAPISVLMGNGGGLDRLGDAKLTATFADDADDPARATAAAERLITDDHAVLLIGGLSAATADAIAGVAQQHGIPFLSLNSIASNVDGLTWSFRIGRTPVNDARSVLRMLGAIAATASRPFQTVAVVVEDSPAGHDRAAPLRSAIEAANLHFIEIPVGPASIDTAVQTLAAAPSDAVLSELGGPDEPRLLAQLAARGVGPLVTMGRGADDPVTDGLFRSVSYSAALLPGRPGVTPIDALFQARTGKPLDAVTARDITGVLLLADIINRAGSTRPIDLRTAFMATDTPGGETLMLWDGIRFDDSGQNVLATPALQQVQQRAFQLVAPASIAVATPIWPAPK